MLSLSYARHLDISIEEAVKFITQKVKAKI
jgi:hypothetical protein